MLKDRTRLLVTNQLQFLPQCDHVIFMYKVMRHVSAVECQPREISANRSLPGTLLRIIASTHVAGLLPCSEHLLCHHRINLPSIER